MLLTIGYLLLAIFLTQNNSSNEVLLLSSYLTPLWGLAFVILFNDLESELCFLPFKLNIWENNPPLTTELRLI